MRDTISAVIPTYNVENLIKPCLESLEWADEIIIVDMFSTDNTIETCKRYPNIKIFQRKDYIFGNINFGIQNTNSDWILRFDSDEVMTQELKEEILEVLEKNGYGFDGFYCKAKLFMFGKELKYGIGKYTYRKQLFKKGYAWYKVQSEHEEMESKGRWGYLKNPYLHYNYRTVNEFFNKTKYYIEKDIERMVNLQPVPITTTLWECLRFFMLFYIQWQGFRDGWGGLLSSFLRGPYYIWQEHRQRKIFVNKAHNK